MIRTNSVMLTSVAWLGFCSTLACAETLQQDFSSDPLQQGWRVSGDTNLFLWDRAGGALRVIWDSSRPNSYFYLPLGTVLTTADDFSAAFDLRLEDSTAGFDPAKPNPFQLAVGFLNVASATDPAFVRGSGYQSPNLAEFDFFPDPGGAWQWGPSLTTALIDRTGTNWFTGGFTADGLVTNTDYHISLTYTATNRALSATISRGGQTLIEMPAATPVSGFQDFALDALSVSSYSDSGQDPAYSGSILAHGIVDNVSVTLPVPPVTVISGASVDAAWRVQFTSRTGWNYVLERTTSYTAWSAVSDSLPGTGQTLVLTDPSPVDAAFYRVRAARP